VTDDPEFQRLAKAAEELIWPLIRETAIDAFKGCKSQADVDARIQGFVALLEQRLITVEKVGSTAYLAPGKVECLDWMFNVDRLLKPNGAKA
jgi:hypothetical protein